MPDASSGGAAFLAGQEIVNDSRTLAYLDAGYGPLDMRISGGCACPRIRELIECDSDPYTSPAADPAPWYDPSVPESADFAGFLTTEFEGMGSTYSREPIGKITGGSVLGRLRAGPRTLIWKGYLFGRTDCAVRFGLTWLTANLKGSSCVCGGEDLDILVCCPELGESPESACIALPAPNQPVACPPFSQPDAFRTLKNVGLISGPTILSQRKVGCRSNCESKSCVGDTLIMEVEFTLLAGNPYLYGCPVCFCTDQTFPTSLPEDCLDRWVKVPPGTLADCSSECPPEEDCTDDAPGICDPAVLPDIQAFQDDCFCDALDPVQTCCEVSAESFGQFFEGAPIIEIYSGSSAMRSTTIRFFSNQGWDCCEAAADPCLECDSIRIRYIPPYSTMIIDGTTRRVTVQCPGGGPFLADHLTVTPFSWPILQCANFCVCVETDGVAVAEDATVSVMVVPREM